ncbi:hypothetical protein [Phaeobacter sp. C3_T13_0]|uniref:hypothetical protein n=1 Tax=Phaeobacter cretensis TaxID=3342641 RepID=UPI0039BC534D
MDFADNSRHHFDMVSPKQKDLLDLSYLAVDRAEIAVRVTPTATRMLLAPLKR